MDTPPTFGRYTATEKIYNDKENVRVHIWLCEDSITNTNKVLKMISFDYLCDSEGPIHLSVSGHPNIATCYESFSTAKYRCLIIERCGLRLHDAIVARLLSLEGLKATLRDVLRGLAHLHRKMVIHRDIKPENILLGFDNNAKIIDFGSAYRFRNKSEEAQGVFTDFIYTTWEYAPPEIFFGLTIPTLTHSYPADIWSLGLVLYEAFSHSLLLPINAGDLHTDVAKKMASLFTECRSYLSAAQRMEIVPMMIDTTSLPDDAADLFQKMVVVDEHSRLSIASILDHPFFSRSVEVEKTGDVDGQPTKRYDGRPPSKG